MGRVGSWENLDGSEMGLENSNLSCQIGFFTKNKLTLYIHTIQTHTQTQIFCNSQANVSAKICFNTTNLLPRSNFNRQFWVSPIQQMILQEKGWIKRAFFLLSINGTSTKQTPAPFFTLSPRSVKQLTASRSHCGLNLHHLWTNPWVFVSQPMTSFLKAVHPRAGMNHFHPMDRSHRCGCSSLPKCETAHTGHTISFLLP